jgi:hypothetical protein
VLRFKLNGLSVDACIELCIKEHERPLVPAVTKVLKLTEMGTAVHLFLISLNMFYTNTNPSRGIFGSYLSFLETYDILSEEWLGILKQSNLFEIFCLNPDITFIFDYYNAFTGMFNTLLFLF